MKFLLVMKFWTDGQPDSTRVRNVEFCFPKMVELSNHLNENGIHCDAKIYDFSPTKIIQNSVFRPYPLGEYKKAQKTNIIMREHPDFNYIFMFDCDAFFSEKDFDKVLNLLKDLPKRKIVTFDLAKLGDSTVEKINNNIDFDIFDEDWWFAYSGPKENGPLHAGIAGGLGGVYLCDLDLLRENNGFDESFVGWGGEDGDMISKIMTSGKEYQILPQREIFPFHLPHFCDWTNEKYNKRFMDI